MNTAVKNEIKNTDNQCSGKTRIGPVPKLNRMIPVMIDVKLVEDSREGVGVTVSQCFLHTLACTEFFFGTLVNQYVGIHSHTQRQHHTGNTGHRQCCLERRRIPNVKNKFSTRAPLATIPGMNPYMEHM